MHLKRLRRIETQFRQRQIHPAGLRVMRIEVHRNDNNVIAIFGMFSETDNLVIVHGVKTQAAITMERRICRANLVHPRDKPAQAIGRIDVPILDLVFFRIQIFLAAGLTRRVDAELERRAIDPVVGA